MSKINPVFFTRSGRLTTYSLSCGYIEQRSTNHDAFRESDLYTSLSRRLGMFEVKQFDRREGEKRGPVFFECVRTLTEARKIFDRQPGKMISSKTA